MNTVAIALAHHERHSDRLRHLFLQMSLHAENPRSFQHLANLSISLKCEFRDSERRRFVYLLFSDSDALFTYSTFVAVSAVVVKPH